MSLPKKTLLVMAAVGLAILAAACEPGITAAAPSAVPPTAAPTLTPAAAATITPTSTPVLPALPDAQAFQAEVNKWGYSYTVQNGKVIVDMHDASQPKVWYEQGPDGSWKTVYSVYGGPLTAEKKTELTANLAESCHDMLEGYRVLDKATGPCVAPLAMPDGSRESFVVISLETGRVITFWDPTVGRVDALEYVSLGKDGQPFTFSQPYQWSNGQQVFLAGTAETYSDWLTPEQISQREAQRNWRNLLFDPGGIWPNRPKNNVAKYFYSQPANLELLRQFFLQGGLGCEKYLVPTAVVSPAFY